MALKITAKYRPGRKNVWTICRQSNVRPRVRGPLEIDLVETRTGQYGTIIHYSFTEGGSAKESDVFLTQEAAEAAKESEASK